MAVLRTISARILVGFAVLILTFGITAVNVIWFVHDVGVEVRVIREGFLQLALKSQAFARSEEDLQNYIAEDRSEDSYRRVQIQMVARHQNRRKTFGELSNVLDALGPVHARHAKRIGETRSRIDGLRKALDELDALYTWFGKLRASGKPGADTPVARYNRALFDGMMKVFQAREERIVTRANSLANKQAEYVTSLANNLEHNEQRLLKVTIYLGASAILVGLLITVWAILTLRPLGRLRDAARRIAAGNYQHRIDESGPAEVADLAREFNSIGQAVEERERALVRSERLAAVGKMAAMITHEVRNPLSSIALNTEMLEDELAKGDSEARDLCRAITREVDRLTALTEEYLAFARLPRPKLVAEQANDVVAAVAGFVREDLMARGVALEVTLAPDLPLARVDPAQLRQCLLNLIRNATEAVSGRPSPRVSLATRIGAVGTIEIEVGDNGPGISGEVQSRLFDPFVSTKQGGTGLGLALTHQIIQDHGGEIRVSSHLERGATFTVVLPLARGTSEVAIPAVAG
jgi:two-component system NtrC family sensor kinase